MGGGGQGGRGGDGLGEAEGNRKEQKPESTATCLNAAFLRVVKATWREPGETCRNLKVAGKFYELSSGAHCGTTSAHRSDDFYNILVRNRLWPRRLRIDRRRERREWHRCSLKPSLEHALDTLSRPQEHFLEKLAELTSRRFPRSIKHEVGVGGGWPPEEAWHLRTSG